MLAFVGTAILVGACGVSHGASHPTKVKTHHVVVISVSPSATTSAAGNLTEIATIHGKRPWFASTRRSGKYVGACDLVRVPVNPPCHRFRSELGGGTPGSTP